MRINGGSVSISVGVENAIYAEIISKVYGIRNKT
jgi:hypothetical protein